METTDCCIYQDTEKGFYQVGDSTNYNCRFMWNGLHEVKQEEGGLRYAKACIRYMIDFYRRHGVAAKYFIAVQEGFTVKYIPFDGK